MNHLLQARRSMLIAVALVCLVPGCGGEKGPVEKEPDGGVTRIAFVTDRDGNNEIYLMDPDGAHLVNLTNHEASDDQPDWSPDGTKIVFASDRSGKGDLYVMNADGTGVTQLTDTPVKESSPAWSPDGKTIAFDVVVDRSVFVHALQTDGSEPRRLAEGMLPSWSADGDAILFNQGQLPTIVTMDADGRNSRMVAPGTAEGLSQRELFEFLFNLSPVMSPDGTRILFTKLSPAQSEDEPGMSQEMWTMAAAGGDLRRVTQTPGSMMGCGWSPDGRKILYVAGKDGNADIHVMNADGTAPTNLTRHESIDREACWSTFLPK